MAQHHEIAEHSVRGVAGQNRPTLSLTAVPQYRRFGWADTKFKCLFVTLVDSDLDVQLSEEPVPDLLGIREGIRSQLFRFLISNGDKIIY